MVRSEWLWLRANISDKHNIRGSVSTGATRIRGWMPSRMVYSGNYTVGGAIMFGGNKENPIFHVDRNAKMLFYFSLFGGVELGTGSDWFDVHCSRFLRRR